MKKDDIFEITTPDGIKMLSIVVDIITSNDFQQTLLCYSKKKLFTVIEQLETNYETGEISYTKFYNGIVSDYVIIPRCDNLLKKYNLNNTIMFYDVYLSSKLVICYANNKNEVKELIKNKEIFNNDCILAIKEITINKSEMSKSEINKISTLNKPEIIAWYQR